MILQAVVHHFLICLGVVAFSLCIRGNVQVASPRILWDFDTEELMIVGRMAGVYEVKGNIYAIVHISYSTKTP